MKFLIIWGLFGAQGSATYVPEQEAMVWKIKHFPGGREYLLRCSFSLPSVASEEQQGRMPPIRVKFEIPMFTVSGIQVRYLKVVEKSGYQALPWVRYITTSGDYEIRMS
jgi:AP-1 complex subunit mu